MGIILISREGLIRAVLIFLCFIPILIPLFVDSYDKVAHLAIAKCPTLNKIPPVGLIIFLNNLRLSQQNYHKN